MNITHDYSREFSRESQSDDPRVAEGARVPEGRALQLRGGESPLAPESLRDESRRDAPLRGESPLAPESRRDESPKVPESLRDESPKVPESLRDESRSDEPCSSVKRRPAEQNGECARVSRRDGELFYDECKRYNFETKCFENAIIMFTETLEAQGGFSKVYRLDENRLLKCVAKELCKFKNGVYVEAYIMHMIKHPLFLNYFENDTHCIIEMQSFGKSFDWYFCHDKKIRSYLYDRPSTRKGMYYNIIVEEIISKMINVVNDIQKLLECKIYHADIKLENILFQPGKYMNNTIHIIDYGMCEFITSTTSSYVGGTQLYMPPEFFAQDTYDIEKRLVWSVGIMIYRLLFGVYPYESENFETFRGCPASAPKNLVEIILATLEIEPDARISLHQLSEMLHSFKIPHDNSSLTTQRTSFKIKP